MAGVIWYEDWVVNLLYCWLSRLNVLQALELHCDVLELRSVFEISFRKFHVAGALIWLQVDWQPAHCRKGRFDSHIGGGTITLRQSDGMGLILERNHGDALGLRILEVIEVLSITQSRLSELFALENIEQELPSVMDGEGRWALHNSFSITGQQVDVVILADDGIEGSLIAGIFIVLLFNCELIICVCVFVRGLLILETEFICCPLVSLKGICEVYVEQIFHNLTADIGLDIIYFSLE